MHRSHMTIRFARSGFTLIELLVVITILVILVSITAASMNWSAQHDRIPNAANEVASFVMGGRDRAIFRRKPTGVRLILDPDGPKNSIGNPITVSSLMYIGSPPPFTGKISIEYDLDVPGQPPPPSITNERLHLRKLRFWSPGPDGLPGAANFRDQADVTDDTVVGPTTDDIDDTGEFGSASSGINPEVSGDPVKDDIRMDGTDPADPSLTSFNDFAKYYNLGLLDTGNRITLSKGGSLGLNFTLIRRAPTGITPPGPGGFDWYLSADFPAAGVTSCMDLDFEIELRPAILPDQEPRVLPRGVVIDLELSRRRGGLPPGWVSYVGGYSGGCPNCWETDIDHYQYSDYMDIIFSSRGTGFGQSAASGLIHLVLAESADIERTDYPQDAVNAVSGGTINNQPFYQLLQTPEQRPNAGQERVVTINPSSGKISVSALRLNHPTSPPLPAGDPSVGIPTDPFRDAEVGKAAP